jgi:hypothetical protein
MGTSRDALKIVNLLEPTKVFSGFQVNKVSGRENLKKRYLPQGRGGAEKE